MHQTDGLAIPSALSARYTGNTCTVKRHGCPLPPLLPHQIQKELCWPKCALPYSAHRFVLQMGCLCGLPYTTTAPPTGQLRKKSSVDVANFWGHLRPPRYPDTVWDPGIPGYMRRSTVLQCGKCRTLLSRDASAAALIGDIFQFQRSRATNTLPPGLKFHLLFERMRTFQR
jgi:hypothetical protein